MVHLSAARVIAARSTGAVSADFVLPWGQDVPARVVNADGDGGLTQRAATSALGKARFTGVPPGRIIVRGKTSDGTSEQRRVYVKGVKP